MSGRTFIDCFSGTAAELPKSKRQPTDILRALAHDPRVSTFEMSETAWLRHGIEDLKRAGLVEWDPKESYPWCRYTITDAGRKALEAAA